MEQCRIQTENTERRTFVTRKRTKNTKRCNIACVCLYFSRCSRFAISALLHRHKTEWAMPPRRAGIICSGLSAAAETCSVQKIACRPHWFAFIHASSNRLRVNYKRSSLTLSRQIVTSRMNVTYVVSPHVQNIVVTHFYVLELELDIVERRRRLLGVTLTDRVEAIAAYSLEVLNWNRRRSFYRVKFTIHIFFSIQIQFIRSAGRAVVAAAIPLGDALPAWRNDLNNFPIILIKTHVISRMCAIRPSHRIANTLLRKRVAHRFPVHCPDAVNLLKHEITAKTEPVHKTKKR